jgi:hypothetical protein
MSGRVPPKRGGPTPPSTGISPLLFRRQRFIAKVATYRPLLILAGLWVVLMAIALFAYGQLLRSTTTVPESAPPILEQPTAAQPSLTSQQPAPAAPRIQAEVISEPDPVATEAGLAVWTWGALVGTCAMGCWALSRYLKSPRRSKPQKKRVKPPHLARAVPPIAPRPPEPKVLPPMPPRLDPYDPAQAWMPPESSAPPRQPPLPPQPAPSVPSTPTDVTVVDETLHHRLDWPEESLINTADVRQRRSLSSFL